MLRRSLILHRWLRNIALISLGLFVFSALTHPVMIWTGPQPAVMHPPSMLIQDLSLDRMQNIIAKQQLTGAQLVKVVPTQSGAAVQVTDQELQPRRYFNLETGSEMIDHDKQHAIWLARHYTQRNDNISNVEFIADFSDEYPWVNRLLPVYKISFDSSDGSTVFIHTETNALSSLGNHWKNTLQFIFRNLHTWSWLDSQSIVRIVLLTVMLVILVTVLITGVLQLLFLRSSGHTPASRRIHRVVGWIMWLPLSALVLSGLFHLQFQQFAKNERGMRVSAPMQLTEIQLSTVFDIEKKLPPVNSMSLVEYEDTLLYRIGFSMKKDNQHLPESDEQKRIKRFNRIPSELASMYIDARTGMVARLQDKDMSIHLAKKFLGDDSVAVKNAELINNFSPEYDFRNKRLPVWKITTGDPEGHRIFVDPATAIIVDYLVPLARIESFSFSLLHKWDFLVPLMGRKMRDTLVVSLLLGFLMLALLGVAIARSKRGT